MIEVCQLPELLLQTHETEQVPQVFIFEQVGLPRYFALFSFLPFFCLGLFLPPPPCSLFFCLNWIFFLCFVRHKNKKKKKTAGVLPHLGKVGAPAASKHGGRGDLRTKTPLCSEQSTVLATLALFFGFVGVAPAKHPASARNKFFFFCHWRVKMKKQPMPLPANEMGKDLTLK